MSKRQPYPTADVKPGAPRYEMSLDRAPRAKKDAAFRPNANEEFTQAQTHTPPSQEAISLGRRGFMGFLGAGLALVGAEGCRRPVEKIVPYQKVPEQVIPGLATHYATVMNRRGEALGLLVESHEGRPTKIEGNPDHPASRGGADLIAQASVLDLYDPDRSTSPMKGEAKASWADFEKDFGAALAAHDKDQGAALRVLAQPANSLTFLDLRRAVKRRFPKATFHTWSAANTSNAREGAKLAFGQYVQPVYNYDRANVILSLDCDFLQTEPGNVRANKLFARRRRLQSTKDDMARLYVVEPSWSTTGTNADHRLRLPAADVAKYLLALIATIAKEHTDVAGSLGDLAKAPPAIDVPAKWLTAVSKDLTARGATGGNVGKSIVVAGSRQPPIVHALCFALNQALGNIGATVDIVAVTDPEEVDNVADLKALSDAMNAGQVQTLVMFGQNPIYDAPADVKFADGLAKVKTSVHVGHANDETGVKSTWHVPRAHELEAWGDQVSLDRAYAVQQPLVSPLYYGRSDIEILALMANAPQRSGYELVRATMTGADGLLLASEGAGLRDCQPIAGQPGMVDCKDAAGGRVPFAMSRLDKRWKKLLRDGVLTEGFAQKESAPGAMNVDAVRGALAKWQPPASPGKGALEVTIAPCPKMLDGRHANNAWLLELPEPMSKIVWDNAAYVSPATARDLGLSNGDVVTLTTQGGRPVDVAVWILHGQADNTIAVTMGWGRTRAGRLGNGKGFDVMGLRTTGAMHFAPVTVAKKGTTYEFGQTQTYDYQYTDVPKPRPDEPRPIVREATLEQYRQAPNFPDLQAPPPRKLPLWYDQDYTGGHQWGMVVDLTACTGCNACVIACQAENNVPVVGKIEAARGREMYWIRLDRYFVTDEGHGATEEDPKVAHQPLMCQQCEEAPCENVCPVNATTHSSEGLNDMAYNRCIGTRYCANNCPYKVRRFNYLNWHNDAVWKQDGDIPETHKMQMNPNVTVRFRGVMEKCTYCVQRIQAAKIKVKREQSDNPARVLRDGEIVTACAQTCPADAIVFGDLNDMSSNVTKLTRLDRQYKLLDDIGTKPRTTYLGKVRNPNPEMA